jgi:hypothetical protein
VLFEDPERRSTSVGVTVSPVRVATIGQFGDVAAVGQRLLEAERKKVGPRALLSVCCTLCTTAPFLKVRHRLPGAFSAFFIGVSDPHRLATHTAAETAGGPR